jgi:hypothetical protein
MMAVTCPRFVYLLVVGVFSWLAGREEAWKDAEILLLRHQLGVLQRQQVRKPRLTWADRGLTAALTSVIPRPRRTGLRLLVPGGAGRDVDQLAAQGRAAGACVEGRGQGPGGAQQVVCDRGAANAV